uniref:C-type lectin domain-containing protein n=1 Tax=Sphaeramia orbicularis TaxID=375764 RepID=A0A673CLH3_9TELE
MYEGGNLASIHSQEENDFLVVLIKGQTCGNMNRTWIGGDDAVQEEFWQWTDGSKFHYTNWAPGEPDHQGPEHCINMKGWTVGLCWCRFHTLV